MRDRRCPTCTYLSITLPPNKSRRLKSPFLAILNCILSTFSSVESVMPKKSDTELRRLGTRDFRSTSQLQRSIKISYELEISQYLSIISRTIRFVHCTCYYKKKKHHHVDTNHNPHPKRLRVRNLNFTQSPNYNLTIHIATSSLQLRHPTSCQIGSAPALLPSVTPPIFLTLMSPPLWKPSQQHPLLNMHVRCTSSTALNVRITISWRTILAP
jgi:hypothetical protein